MTKLPKGSLISFMANKVKSQGGINLAQGIPAFAPPTELIEQLKIVSDLAVHQYAPGAGNKALLQLLIQQYKTYNITEKNLLITNGATESISLIFTYLIHLLGSNFSALAFDPVYESYKHLPRILNISYSSFELDKHLNINFEQLEDKITAGNIKAVFVASPGNPLGKIWSKNECTRLIELAEKHKFYIIWDAVYSQLYFKNPPFEPLKQQSTFVFYVNAFSKQLSITGWRLGYMIIHESHHEAMLDIHDYIGLCAPSLLQEALARYLEKNELGHTYTIKLRKILSANYKLFSAALKQLDFKTIDVQGGYFLWCKLPKKYTDGFLFAIDLFEKKQIACVPGIHFSEKGKEYVRFNIAQEQETLIEAILGIKHYTENT